MATGKVNGHGLVVQMLPEEFIEMMAEIHDYHESLWPIVQGAKDIGQVLEEVATYCGVLIQGRAVVSQICKKLKRELEKHRKPVEKLASGIILVH